MEKWAKKDKNQRKKHQDYERKDRGKKSYKKQNKMKTKWKRTDQRL